MSTDEFDDIYDITPDHQQANGDSEYVGAVESFASFVGSANGDSYGMKRYRDLPHRSSNETLKAHTNFSIKLSETGELNYLATCMYSVVKKCLQNLAISARLEDIELSYSCVCF